MLDRPLLAMATRLYRFSLHCYPTHYLRQERRELVLLFNELAQRALYLRGVVALIFLLIRSILDSALWGWQARNSPSSADSRSVPSQTYHSLQQISSTRQESAMYRLRHNLTQDLRSAWRSLWRRPALSLVAIATLAIGIGASVSMFSIVYGVLLRPLGLEQPDRLVNIRQHAESDATDSSGLSPVVFNALRDNLSTTVDLAGWFYESVTLGSGGIYQGETLEFGTAIVTTTNFFQVLGVRPIHGRMFEASDATEGGGIGTTVVLGERTFEGTFGGDQSVIGKSLMIDGKPMTVVGVASSVLPAPIAGTEIWLPHGLDVADRALTRRILPLARLASNVTLAQNAADLDNVFKNLAKQHPSLASWTATPTPFRADLLGAVERGLWIAFSGIGLLLLLACANFANLMMARLSTRKADLQTRACLGATKSVLLVQLTMESLLISILGGLAGTGIAFLMHRYLINIAAQMLPRVAEVRIDLPVLAFAFLIAVLCGLLFGNAPAALGIAGSLGPSAGQQRGGSRVGSRLRGVLAGAQIALAVILLAGAALLVNSFQRLVDSDPGFDASHVAAARIYLDDDRYASLEQRDIYFDALKERLASIPGVLSVATTSALPMDPQAVDFDIPYRRAGAEVEDPPPQAYYRVSSPGYFETLGIKLKSGRTFHDTDISGPPAVIINETLARRAWPNSSAVGDQLVVSFRGTETYEVVGVVSDTSFSALGVDPKPEMYFPVTRISFGGRVLAVRTTDDASKALPLMRAAALEIDPNQPLNSSMTLQSLTAASVATQHFYSKLSSFIGILALVLAVSGVYALISFWVSNSRFELGIRMAFGATRGRILRLVLAKALLLATLGSLAGAALSLVLLGNLRSLLFEVAPLDPRALFFAAAALTVAALLASLIPAQIASRLNPAQVLSD